MVVVVILNVMIDRELAVISEVDIQLLIDNGVAESRTLEYKRELPGGADEAKREFLSDISAMANTAGGDLIFGVEEDQGVPIAVRELQCADFDHELGRLENLIRDGLEPRISYQVKRVQFGSSGILMFRVDRSLSGPHRVIFRGHDKFYARNSTGKYGLDTDELRRAFLGSSARMERVRQWRIDRILNLSRNETPVSPFSEGGKLVLHCVPLTSFDKGARYDVVEYGRSGKLEPFGDTSYSNRLNFEGAIAHDCDATHHHYTQLYRNGSIEAVDGRMLNGPNKLITNKQRFLSGYLFEKQLIEYLPKFLSITKKLGANCPIMVGVSLLGIRGIQIAVNHQHMDFLPPLDRDSLLMPEVWVPSFTEPSDIVLKPIFDLVWNAFGSEKSPYYDIDGRSKIKL